MDTDPEYALKMLLKAFEIIDQYVPDHMLTNPDHDAGIFHGKLYEYLQRMGVDVDCS